MKLSRLYSSKPDLFEPVEFVQGLNVVMAEIRLPENRNKDTHNLGKTTLGRLLDFGFLAKRDPKFFLFKHTELFQDFIFFLEIELEDASFVTIRRGMEEATKISFKRHEAGHQDLSGLPLAEWDHQDMPFERARDLLDGLLDWRALKPWAFRKGLGYLLRSQDDFRDVFHLRKFAAAHSDWKPFLAHVLGFDAQLVAQHYEKEEQLTEKQSTAQTIKNELGGSIEDISKIEGILLLKQKEAEKKQKLLDAFDFRAQDKDSTKQLVDDIDERIASLNAERYSLNQNKKKIITSLEEDQILFNPDEAQRLFEEAGILERHDFGDGRARYEESVDDHHDHLIDVQSGKVIEFNNVSKAFGDRLLIDNLSMNVPAGAIVGIIGPNGAGKSTLFKMITGQDKPDTGEVVIGPTVKIAYVDQSRDCLDGTKTVFDELAGGADILTIGKFEMPSRAYIGRFNFKGGDQQKLVGNLSGGERGRLHLAKTLMTGGNVLLLDEPSNDLDVETLRALEDALLEFAGCALIISHDRWFLDRICTHILAAEGDSQWTFFAGNYQEYEEDKRKRLGEEGAKPKRIRYKPIAR